MSVRTDPASRRHRRPEPTGAATERRPAGRTIVGSVVAGGVAALLLSLVVFAGGSEATITGALLLGFGFGWALLAALTVRRTGSRSAGRSSRRSPWAPPGPPSWSSRQAIKR